MDSTQNKNQISACIKYSFVLNALYRKLSNMVFVNKFVENHNHALNNTKNLQQFSLSLCKIPDNIIEEIRFYV